MRSDRIQCGFESRPGYEKLQAPPVQVGSGACIRYAPFTVGAENPQEFMSTVGEPPGQVTVATLFASRWTVATVAPDGS